MKTKSEIKTLLKKTTLAADERALSEILSTLTPAYTRKPLRVAFVNAHALNLCFKNAGFRRNILDSDYIFRDGSGMKILYRMLGVDPGLNLNGTDLIPRIIGLYAGQDVALLGTEEPFLGRSANAVREKGVTPVLTMDGFQDDSAYLDALRNQPASLIVLAMGMPKQERVAALLAANLDYPCLIICGGAILDFMGGKVKRAPVLIRRLGIEWVYRLAQEPRRLFQRYIVGNFVFLFRGFGLALDRVYVKSFNQK